MRLLRKYPCIKTVSSEEAYKLWTRKKQFFLDNRPKAPYDAVRIPGAVWLYDEDILDDPKVVDKLDKDKEYVVYCGGVT